MNLLLSKVLFEKLISIKINGTLIVPIFPIRVTLNIEKHLDIISSVRSSVSHYTYKAFTTTEIFMTKTYLRVIM